MAEIRKNEEAFYPLVQSGILIVTEAGEIWRTAERWGGRNIPCFRRAEQPSATYLRLGRRINGTQVHALAHRLVWRHFNGPIPDGLTINHKDGVKTNNHPSNLELATLFDQMQHAVHTLKVGIPDQRGEMNYQATLSDKQAAEIRARRAQGEKPSSLSAEYGVSPQHIWQIATGRRRPAELIEQQPEMVEAEPGGIGR